MIRIGFEGGLGNQMFSYAMGRYLQNIYGEEIEYDISRYICENGEIRNFELLNFNIDQRWKQSPIVSNRVKRLGLSYLIYRLISWPFIRINKNRYIRDKKLIGTRLYEALTWRLGQYYQHFPVEYHMPKLYKWNKISNLRGMWFWMDMVKAMEPILKEELRVISPISDENDRILNAICAITSVGVHIRRGDYVSLGLIVCGIDYYENAMRRMQNEVIDAHFFIFSDDIPWVKENLNTDGLSVTYVDNDNTSPEDMRLLSSCKHFIMSNSTFSWWGAFLGKAPDKIVYIPKYWDMDKRKCAFMLSEWTPIENIK